ncbi:MAG: hypothetical protein JXP34_24835 [Planctomycetes bacterium]|nr:hypothetical protein [Planctomycetota bacterium]
MHLFPVLFLLQASLVGADEEPLWLAVTRPSLAEAVAPLAAHRRSEGFEAVISTAPVAEAIASAPRRPAFLLLAGDDETGREGEPWSLPAKRLPLYRWRAPQPSDFSSDAAYGDIDGDLAPDIPVGRIPARTEDELERIIDKIIAFETRAPVGDDLRFLAWAGAPGYGPFIDTLATGFLVSIVRSQAPPWTSPWLISAAWGHPLCGWPPDQPERYTRELRRGAMLAAFMAHASPNAVYSMAHEGRPIFYGAAEARDGLAEGPPCAPMIILACHAGAFVRHDPCMAEAFLALPGGPPAVIAATTESHPLTNYFTGKCLLAALAGDRRRIGDLWLRAQDRAFEARDPIVERVLRDAEGKLEPEIDTAKLRRDQRLMYVLLGDPAMRLKIPDPLDVRIERSGSAWRWKVARPDGAVRLSVGLRRATAAAAAFPPPPANAGEARERFDAANAEWVFAPIAVRGSEDAWEGEIAEPGLARFVVTGAGLFRAAAHDLK